jgi:hypothetical protein
MDIGFRDFDCTEKMIKCGNGGNCTIWYTMHE